MTAEEIELELSLVNQAISHILKGGQSYTINSGGSIRVVTMANLKDLRRQRSELQAQLDALNGCAGLNIGAAW